jgi:hypothetical protein
MQIMLALEQNAHYRMQITTESFMTDRVVLSAQRLGITHYEYKAALQVRELFASGKVWHDRELENLKPDGFNMNVPLCEGECGTTACIGGWMFLAMQRDRTNPCFLAAQYVNSYRSEALGPLFFPFTDLNGHTLLDDDGEDYDFPFELMPPEFGLAAIDNFLTTGDPNWPAIAVTGKHWFEQVANA